jgi:hypothetical protein
MKCLCRRSGDPGRENGWCSEGTSGIFSLKDAQLLQMNPIYTAKAGITGRPPKASRWHPRALRRPMSRVSSPEQAFPDAAPRPAHKAVVDRCRRTIVGRAIAPATAALQHGKWLPREVIRSFRCDSIAAMIGK